MLKLLLHDDDDFDYLSSSSEKKIQTMKMKVLMFTKERKNLKYPGVSKEINKLFKHVHDNSDTLSSSSKEEDSDDEE